MKKLGILDTSCNKLSRIDLRPLSQCERLKMLRLERNQLKKIDLSPLAGCKGLAIFVDFGVEVYGAKVKLEYERSEYHGYVVV